MNPINPLDLIRSDHEKTKSMLGEYEKSGFEGKKSLARQINQDLVIHMIMEEKFFYPELEKVSEEAMDAIEESLREHEEVKKHICHIGEAKTEENMDEHVGMMKEGLLHHMAEEEGKIFNYAENNLKQFFLEMSAKMTVWKAKAKGEALVEDLMAKVV